MPRSEQQKLEQKKEVRRKASRYILEKFGDRLWAGEPTYDERSRKWKVNIHSRSLLPDDVLGEITLDAYASVVKAPSRRALQREFQRHELATSLEPDISVALAHGRGDADQGPLAIPDLPDDPKEIGQELLADPDMKKAYRYLRLSLANPQIRQSVLAALEAFARAARKRDNHPN